MNNVTDAYLTRSQSDFDGGIQDGYYIESAGLHECGSDEIFHTVDEAYEYAIEYAEDIAKDFDGHVREYQGEVEIWQMNEAGNAMLHVSILTVYN